MRIYYSMPSGFTRIAKNDFDLSHIQISGWGHLIERTKVYLEKAGCDLVDHPEGADIEFLVGQPPFRLKPEMHPALCLSMYETTQLPQYWVDTFNLFDSVVNPSHWGKRWFAQNGVRVPIYVIPLGVDTDRFSFVEREVKDKWIYIAQAVQLNDRKEIRLVAELFRDRKMPSDTHLILKTMPHRLNPLSIRLDLDAQVEWIQEILPWDVLQYLYSQCHVSVNPSAGEGFGFLPSEHMLSGMCAIFTDYSGMQMFANPDCNFPISCTERISPHYPQGKDALIDVGKMYDKMVWTYEHQDEALEMGRRASQWISGNFTFEIMVNRLVPLMENLIRTVPKKVEAFCPSDPIEEWIHPEDVWGYRAQPPDF